MREAGRKKNRKEERKGKKKRRINVRKCSHILQKFLIE